MPGKYFDLDLDITLGGEQSSNITVASQKAIKTYVDTNVPTVADVYSATSSDAMSGKAVADALSQIDGTKVTFRAW